MTLKEHLLNSPAKRDLRALISDILGISILSPDQEKAIEVLQSQPRVALMGGTGTGKTFCTGLVAAICIPFLKNSKALFGAGKFDQASKLSWLEMSKALILAKNRKRPLGDNCNTTIWYPAGRDEYPGWFATCMAMSESNNATSISGMLHAPHTFVFLDELTSIHPLIANVLDAGTTQDNAHFITSFNPIDENDAAGIFWLETPEAGRVQFSALDCAEWQERTGVYIPGMPTLAAIEAKWKGKEQDPMYYTSVLGQFPPKASSEWRIVSNTWFDKCVGQWNPTPEDLKKVAIGVDTSYGRGDEIVVAVACGRFLRVEWASFKDHETPKVAAKVKEIANRYNGKVTPIMVDIIGGGMGLCDDLAADGYFSIPMNGGAHEINDKKDETELSNNNVTWTWFSVRNSVIETMNNPDSDKKIIFCPPADGSSIQIEREQWERKFLVSGERKYIMESKNNLHKSPDRADAEGMAWLARNVFIDAGEWYVSGV